MGGGGSGPKIDPAVEEANRRERERAEQERLKAAQQQLLLETDQRSVRFGRRSLLSGGAGGFAMSRSLLGGGG